MKKSRSIRPPSSRSNGNGNGHRNGRKSSAANWNSAAIPWSTPRLAPRYSSLSELAVTYEGESQDIVTRPPDISTRGMFINTSRVFPEGAVLNVSFRLVLSRVFIHARGEVRYCLPGVGVGVEFIDISPDDVGAIENEIKAATRQTLARK